MKKLLLVFLFVAVILNYTATAEMPDPATVYQTDQISFSIIGTYRHSYEPNDFIIIGFNWKNLASEPIYFGMKLLVSGYQNGKEISKINYEPDYDTDVMSVNSMTKIMPGYENIDYEFIPIKDDSEVTIVIDKAFEVGNTFDEITYRVMPSDLPEFQWPEEE